MLTISVHIANEIDFLDRNVSVLIKLSAVPVKGSILRIGHDNIEKLNQLAANSLKIGEKYADYMYGKSRGVKNVRDENLKDIDFTDAQYVDDVMFVADSPIIYVELSNNRD